MPRRGGAILIALGFVLAVASGFLVYYLLQQAGPIQDSDVAVAPTATPVPTRPIPVAARPLALGDTISTTDVLTRPVPIDLPIVGVISQTDQLVGMVVVEPIQEGEFFRPGQLGTGSQAPLSDQIEAGEVILAFSPQDLLMRSRVLREGDHLDLLLTIEVQEETPTETRQGRSTNFTLQNVEVKRIVGAAPTTENPNPEPEMFLFEMTPQDAVIAKFVRDVGGTIDFTLRARADTEPFITEAINQDYLFDNYGFRAPQSSARQGQE